MKRSILGLTVLVCLLVASGVFAQQSGESSVARVTAAEPASPAAIGISPLQQAAVPRLIKFNGTLRDLSGKPIAGPADVTFSLYAEESGGAPLWFETQTVQANSLGRYTVLLGAMTPAGVPMELFTSGEAHWLGTQVGNLPEQARVLLVSVPYAMKAGDAETLGGKPASAFMPASPTGSGAAAEMMSGLVAASVPTTAGSRITPALPCPGEG